MPLPAPRQRQVRPGELPRHHPEREHIAPVRAKAVAAVFAGNRRGMQPGLEQIVEVVGRECRQPIVLGRPRSEAIGSQRRRAFDKRLSAARKSEVDHHDCQSDLVVELAPVRVGPVAAAVSIESTLAGNSTLYPP